MPPTPNMSECGDGTFRTWLRSAEVIQVTLTNRMLYKRSKDVSDCEPEWEQSFGANTLAGSPQGHRAVRKSTPVWEPPVPSYFVCQSKLAQCYTKLLLSYTLFYFHFIQHPSPPTQSPSPPTHTGLGALCSNKASLPGL